MMRVKKLLLFGISTIVISVIISLLTFCPMGKNYKRDFKPWMSMVDDNRLITNLSIPGTHNSGATHSIFDVSGKCQDNSIKEQLYMGVRFFDIRLQLVKDELKIVHSFVDQKLKFMDVMDELSSFVNEYDTEFLIISIKQEEGDKNSSEAFKDVLLDNLNTYDVVCFDNDLPTTIKDARGKIYILSRCAIEGGLQAYYGWQDSTTFTIDNLYIQDNYCTENIDEKQNDIIKTIEYSNNSNNMLVLNFTSCYLDGKFPPTYAGTAALSINPWLEDYLSINDKNKLGIIIVDFVNTKLCMKIYERNLI